MIPLLFLAALLQQVPEQPSDPYAALRLYDGAWHVTMRESSGKTRNDSLADDCHAFRAYFACQQTVNGKVGALLVFVPGSQPGHFTTQNLMPDGRALGTGDLTIEGPHWTYMGHDEENGKTTWYRTTNDFTGNDRIHFESAQSSDQKNWTVTMSGDEVRDRAANP